MRRDWWLDGVNTSLPHNRGDDCDGHGATLSRRWAEGVIVTTLAVYMLQWSIVRVRRAANVDAGLAWPTIHAPSLNWEKNACGNSGTAPSNKNVPGRDGRGSGGVHGASSAATATTTTATVNNSVISTYDKLRFDEPVGKQILLVAMTLIFGMEIGFKFASKTVIYILNPCHVTTVIQIYLLASRPSKTATALFRIQMNYMNGPLLAFLFPETDSRQFPMEEAIYWMQHGLMFIIPVYLLQIGGAYTIEDLSDFNWNVISYALILIYHFFVLHIVSVWASVNLNHMLCPALLDPFVGPNYRLAAVFHEAFLCALLSKTYYCIFSNAPLHPPIPSLTPSINTTISHRHGKHKTGDYDGNNSLTDDIDDHQNHHHTRNISASTRSASMISLLANDSECDICNDAYEKDSHATKFNNFAINNLTDLSNTLQTQLAPNKID